MSNIVRLIGLKNLAEYAWAYARAYEALLPDIDRSRNTRWIACSFSKEAYRYLNEARRLSEDLDEELKPPREPNTKYVDEWIQKIKRAIEEAEEEE